MFTLQILSTELMMFNYLWQGLEIVNPSAAERRGDETNAKYFSATSGFLSVKKNGFAVPAPIK